jgi:hypothetical protein
MPPEPKSIDERMKMATDYLKKIDERIIELRKQSLTSPTTGPETKRFKDQMEQLRGTRESTVQTIQSLEEIQKKEMSSTKNSRLTK